MPQYMSYWDTLTGFTSQAGRLYDGFVENGITLGYKLTEQLTSPNNIVGLDGLLGCNKSGAVHILKCGI